MDIGDPVYETYSLIMANLEVYYNRSGTSNGEPSFTIVRPRLPFTLEVFAKESFDFKATAIDEIYSYAGFTLVLRRTNLGQLLAGYYGPTGIFALLSSLSYMIPPEQASVKTNLQMIVLIGCFEDRFQGEWECLLLFTWSRLTFTRRWKPHQIEGSVTLRNGCAQSRCPFWWQSWSMATSCQNWSLYQARTKKDLCKFRPPIGRALSFLQIQTWLQWLWLQLREKKKSLTKHSRKWTGCLPYSVLPTL